MIVLIVDSDEQRRLELARGLKACGHVVLAAADVVAAEWLTRERRVDVAVCDTDLVLGTGTFLAHALRHAGSTLLYLRPDCLAPSGLKTLWLDRAADACAVVRVVEQLQPPRPNSELSNT